MVLFWLTVPSFQPRFHFHFSSLATRATGACRDKPSNGKGKTADLSAHGLDAGKLLIILARHFVPYYPNIRRVLRIDGIRVVGSTFYCAICCQALF